MAEHWGLILVAAAAGAVMFSAVLGRLPPLKIVDSKIEPQEVHRGDHVASWRKLLWERHDCSQIGRSTALIDSLNVTHLFAPENMGGAHWPTEYYAHEVQVPLGMPFGKTTYLGVLQFACWPWYSFWPVEVLLPPVTFTVVP